METVRSGKLYLHGNCNQYVERWPVSGLLTRKALRILAKRVHSAAVTMLVNMPLYMKYKVEKSSWGVFAVMTSAKRVLALSVWTVSYVMVVEFEMIVEKVAG